MLGSDSLCLLNKSITSSLHVAWPWSVTDLKCDPSLSPSPHTTVFYQLSCLLSSSLLGFGDMKLTCALRGIQTARQLLQETRPGCVPAVFLAFVVLLGHQWVVEPGSTEAAVLAGFLSSIPAVHGHRPGQCWVWSRARVWVCGLWRGRGGILEKRRGKQK